MGLLSHRVKKSEIKAGDHIYTWRAVFAYSHHGIYVGGNKVVHFTHEKNMGSSEFLSLCSSASNSRSSLEFSALSSEVQSTCPNIPDCGFRQPESGVILSCLDCFLGNGSLYRFEYGVITSVFLVKLRGGTTVAKSDAPDAVIHRAMHLLQNGFGNYDIFKHNCEDFALYCKTGLLVLDQNGLGTSGQAACFIGAPLAVIIASPFKLFMSGPVGFLTATAGMYCMSRYATDIGVRTDVIKLKVEDMALFHGCEGPTEELAEDNQRFEGKLMFNETEGPASKRKRCM